MNYKVYMHVCPNGKKYIGITKNEVNYRWRNGANYKNNIHFSRAIQKYKWENINHIILFENLSKDEAEEKEIQMIKKYKSNNQKYGYNIENGGNCIGSISNIQKNKISKSLKEYYKNNYEAKQRISIANKGNKYCVGRILSKETKEKISNSHLKSEKKNKYKKPVICIETDLIYDSIKEAGRTLHIDNRSIQKVCKGERKSAGKLHWKFAKEE